MESPDKTIIERVNEANKLLQESEPDSISYDSFNDYTGYKPQYVVRAMNKAFGYDGWSFEEKEMKVTEPAPDGKGQLAIAKVEVRIKGIDKSLAAWGQSKVTKGAIGDAMKGAQTDALKKALSYFDIGQRAYFGLLPKPRK